MTSLRKNYIYVGISNNPKSRTAHHNKGYNRTTKPYKPFRILLIEKFNSRIGARIREKFLKSGCGKELIRKKYK
ncbi:MAG: GIY-YIG nuclease family protein [Patescibacteria group bacterium]|nr:GIY-YIG nuclease family protein [Patescibacteria group bacterium]